ncbi:MAG: hypothetical protein WD335_03235 [Candidatus Paceibacterota bacterium]
MAPSFEQFNNISAEGNTNEKAENGGRERISSEEAFEVAEQKVVADLDEFSEQLEEGWTVRLKGREWSADELPEEYLGVALMQKKLQLLQDQLEKSLLKNQETDPGTDEETISYFEAQMWGRITDIQQLDADLAAKNIGLKLQHPDLARAHKDMKVAA